MVAPATPRRARREWREGLLTPGRLLGPGLAGLSSPVALQVIASLRPRLAAAALQCQRRLRGHAVRRCLLASAGPRGRCWAAIPRAALARLQPHQLGGVRWLFAAWARGGGILADDPGLGKTLQILVLLDALAWRRLARRVLVAVPANLLGNWEVELRRWRAAGVIQFLNPTVVRAGDSGLRPEDHLRALARRCAVARAVAAASPSCLPSPPPPPQ